MSDYDFFLSATVIYTAAGMAAAGKPWLCAIFAVAAFITATVLRVTS